MAETTLQGIVDQYSKPMDFSGLQKGLVSGADLGNQLANRQMEQQRLAMEMQFKQQTLTQQKMEHMTGLMDAAVKEQDPTLRKVRFKQVQTVGNVLGYPISDDVVDAFTKSDALRDNYLKSLPYRDLQKPEERANAIRDGMGAMMGGPTQLADFLNKQTESQDKLAQAKALAERGAIASRESGTQKRISDLIPYAESLDDAKALQNGTSDPRFMEAFGRAQVGYANQVKTLKQADISQKQTAAEKNKAETKAIPERVAIEGLRLKLQKSTDTQKIVQDVFQDTSQDRKDLDSVNKARTLFQPNPQTGNVPLAQFNLGITTLDREFSGTARAGQTIYQGTKWVDKYTEFKNIFEKWSSGQPSDAPVPKNILKTYNGLLDAVTTPIKGSIKQRAAGRFQSAQLSGLMDKNDIKVALKGLTNPESDKYMQSLGIQAIPNPSQQDSTLKPVNPQGLNYLKALPNMQTGGKPDMQKIEAYLNGKGQTAQGAQ